MSLATRVISIAELGLAFNLTSTERRDLALALTGACDDDRPLGGLTVPVGAAFEYCWNLGRAMVKSLDSLTIEDYTKYLETQSLALPQAASEPVFQPKADVSDLVRLESLEHVFAPDGFTLRNFLENMILKLGGAYEADGCPVTPEGLKKAEDAFVDMVYRHCADFIKAQEADPEKYFSPAEAGTESPCGCLRLIDNSPCPYPVPAGIYQMHLALERMYWELRQAKAAYWSAKSRAADQKAAEWLEKEIFVPGRSDPDLPRRLSTYAGRFKSALLEMKTWYGLYSFYLKRDEAVKELLLAGYRPRGEAPDLTLAMISGPMAAVKEKQPSSTDAPSKPRRVYTKGEATIREAAGLCLVGESTVRKWEKGRAPEGWPGRTNMVELKKFANLYRSRRATALAAAEMKKPVSLRQEHLLNVTKSVFDDD